MYVRPYRCGLLRGCPFPWFVPVFSHIYVVCNTRAVKCFSEPFCFVIVIFLKKVFCYNTLDFFVICLLILNWNNVKIVIVISIWNNVKIAKNKHCY